MVLTRGGKMWREVGGFTLSLLVAAAAHSAHAEALEFQCIFPTRATADGVARQEFDMTFVLDTVSGEAFIRGNSGISAVIPHRGDVAFTFVEILSSGAFQSTTIADTGEAVHSRHTILGGTVMSPSQNYGWCS